MKTRYWAFVWRDDKRILKMECPTCRTWGDLENHSVDEAGQVLPSVDCPSCDYHEFTQLIGFPNNPYKGKTY